MRSHGRAVEGDPLRPPFIRQGRKHLFPNAFLCPTPEVVAECSAWAIFLRCRPPGNAGSQHMNDTAYR